VNAKNEDGDTPVDFGGLEWEVNLPGQVAVRKEIADLIRKNGGKTGEELKAAGN